MRRGAAVCLINGLPRRPTATDRMADAAPPLFIKTTCHFIPRITCNFPLICLISGFGVASRILDMVFLTKRPVQCSCTS